MLYSTVSTAPITETRVSIGERYSITLFSIQELLKIYPNAYITKQYLYIDDNNCINIENYTTCLKNLRLFRDGHGIIRLRRKIMPIDFKLIDGKMYFDILVRVPYDDLFIDTGFYIRNWMIKKITHVGDNTTIFERRIIEQELSQEIDQKFKKIVDFGNEFTIST